MSSNKFDQRILELVNQERSRAGLDSLSIDSQLDEAANLHTDGMVQANYMSHDGFNERADATGYEYVTENVAYTYNTGGEPEELAERVMDMWIGSSGHYQNIMDPNVTHLGVGYGNVNDADDLENYDPNSSGDLSEARSYFTQIFGSNEGNYI